jgi:hypothetical protein
MRYYINVRRTECLERERQTTMWTPSIKYVVLAFGVRAMRHDEQGFKQMDFGGQTEAQVLHYFSMYYERYSVTRVDAL